MALNVRNLEIYQKNLQTVVHLFTLGLGKSFGPVENCAGIASIFEEKYLSLTTKLLKLNIA